MEFDPFSRGSGLRYPHNVTSLPKTTSAIVEVRYVLSASCLTVSSEGLGFRADLGDYFATICVYFN